MLESLIAYHCAPALMGIKPANIAAVQKERIPNIYDEIERLNQQLCCRDIYLTIVSDSDKRVLIMVYRRKMLENHIYSAENSTFLAQFGYPSDSDIDTYLSHLKMRMTKEDFPHEIGVFLGYPLHDIHCFINNRDGECLFIGEWRVYHNVEEAKKLFLRYKICRDALVKRIIAGKSLAQMFCAT